MTLQGLVRAAAVLFVLTFTICGCKKADDKGAAGSGAGGRKVRLTLDWKPEPEFGGFYEAGEQGAFAKQGLDVELRTAGPGAPTWQLVASGQTEFATTAADQVLVAREQGADVVALFAVYQTSPQAIMAHKARGFISIGDVFENTGTLAAEPNAWLTYLTRKYPNPKVKITGYGGGVAGFLAKPDYSQQCFVFSEPLLAERQGGDPQTFLVADAGYNPYTTVVIAKGDYVRANAKIVKALVTASRDGWRGYLDHPEKTNAAMLKLNKEADAQTFAAMAEAQKPLIETAQTKQVGLGTMTAERWTTLAQQLVDLGVIKNAPAASECFADVDKLP
jgi:NitT/TauT family transport system substrate-binding protein